MKELSCKTCDFYEDCKADACNGAVCFSYTESGIHCSAMTMPESTPEIDNLLKAVFGS